MNVVIRVDASAKLGSGHVMRCLILAKLLRSNGVQICFVCRELPGDLISFIEESGYDVLKLPYMEEVVQEIDATQSLSVLKDRMSKVDWLVIDHYHLDYKWEEYFREMVSNILVIDDLANRKHHCDVLLDQNYYLNMSERYQSLVPQHCKKLLGPSFLLLRDEFQTSPIRRRGLITKVRNLLIFFGGSDPTNETEKVLLALKNLNLQEVQIDVVVGSSNQNKKRIEELARQLGATFHCQIDYLANLMNQADVAFGAGGVTMWERCFLAVPSIVTIVAENQRESTEAAARVGAIWNLGWYEGVHSSTYERVIIDIMRQPEKMNDISEKARLLMKNSDKARETLLHLVLGSNQN